MASTGQSVLGRLSGRAGSGLLSGERSRLPFWVFPVAGLCLLAIYVVGYDQGTLLYAVFGDASLKLNYVHEYVHDGRHLLAFACH